MGSVQFQIAPHTSRYLQAPSGVVGVIYRGFNLLHWSLLKCFPLFIWLLFAVSSVSNFLPDIGGRRWSLAQVRWFSPAAGREGRCRQTSLCVGSPRRVPATLVCPAHDVCFPIYTAQAPGCSVWSGPCVACSSSFPVPHKSADWAGPAFCAFPVQAAPAARSLMGASSPLRAQPQLLRSGRVRLVSVLGGWPLASTLADVDHPESKEVFG